MNEVKKFLLDSGKFTQVEPEWLEEDQGYATLVNKYRGVVAICHLKQEDSKNIDYKYARMFFDTGGLTYYSSGWYTQSEFENFIFPIMESNKAWDKFCELANTTGDITIALDYVGRT